MTPAGKVRRACALLKSGPGQPAGPRVEQRPLFSYWSVLMPHFRGVLLPPGNRLDEGIQWSWTEGGEKGAVSGAELATIRRRLAGARQSLADAQESEAEPAAKTALLRAVAQPMGDIVGALLAQPDATLAGYVARTERGLLLHSWGLGSPLSVQFLDADLEIAGRVTISGAPARNHEVRLETSEVAAVTRAETDASGRFKFSKLVPGNYRVRAISRSPGVAFAEAGQPVDLHGPAGATVEIRSEDRSQPSISPVPRPSSARGLQVAASLAALLLAGAVAYFWPRKNGSRDGTNADRSSAWNINNSPHAIAESERAAHEEAGRGARGATVTGGRDALLPGETGNARRIAATTRASSHDEAEPSKKSGQASAKAIAAAGSTSGLPTGPVGTPAGGGSSGGGAAPGSGAGGAAGGGADGAASGGSGNSAGGSAAAGSGAGSNGGTGAAPAPTPATMASFVAPPDMPSEAGKPRGSSPAKPARSSPSPSSAAAADSTDRDSSTDGRGADGDGLSPDTQQGSGAPATLAEASVAQDMPPGNGADEADGDGPASASVNEDQGRLTKNGAEKTGSEAAAGASIPVDVASADEDNSPSDAVDSAWVVRTQFQPGPWRRLLVRDTIVPTLPVPRGQKDGWDDLGARMLAEKQAAVPAALQAARLVIGVRVELPTTVAAAGLHWEMVSGAVPLLMKAVANGAEIGWAAGSGAGEYRLVDSSGRKVATISTDTRHGVRVAGAGRFSSWPWVAIESSAGGIAGFAWQLLGAAAKPPSWTEDSHWADGRGRRVDLRLPADKDDTVAATLAIVDASTGWALASKVEQRQRQP